MKKLILIFLIALIGSSVFALEITPYDPSSLGKGGSYVTDYSDFYTIFRNPAGLGLTGNHGYILGAAINVGGPLEKVPSIVDDLNTGREFTEILPEVISDGFKLNLNLGLTGPLMFGKTSSTGFGWAFLENIKADASIPSLTLAKLTAQVETAFVAGYGFNINLEGLRLSVGATGEAYAKVPQVYLRDTVANLAASFQNFDSLPMNAVVGLSCDVGAQARLFNLIDVGVIWENCFSPYFTKTATVSEVINDYTVLTNDFGSPAFKSMNFKVGVGLDIFPNGALGGLISDFKIYGNINDFGLFFRHFIDKELSALERSPWLNFNVGAEVGLLKLIYARVGYRDGFLTAGAGAHIGVLCLDAALYTNELGAAPGNNNQLNVCVSVGINY